MTELYSQFASGTQITAGTITGSALGASGLNNFADRLNTATNANGLIIGSVISGTSTSIWTSGTGGNLSNSGFFESTTGQATTSASFIDYANGSVVITTGSNPIFCIASATFFDDSNDDKGGTMRISRNNESAVSISQDIFFDGFSALDEIDVPCTVNWIDRPGAGTHTYEVQFEKGNADECYIDDVQLSVVELRNHI